MGVMLGIQLVAMRSVFAQNLNYDLKVDREELTQFVQHIHSLVGKAFPTKPAPIPQNPTMNYPANANFQLHRTPVNIEQLMSPVSIWSSIPTTSSSPMTTGNVFDFTMMNRDVSLRSGANAHTMWATTPTSLDSSSLNSISSIDSFWHAFWRQQVLMSHLISKFGHLVVGIDGFNTSKACPICYRRLVYLKNCRRRVNQCLHCDNQIFHRDVASGQLIASLAKRKFNGEQYPQQFNRPDRPPAPPAQPPPANPLDLPPIPEAPIPDRAQNNQEEESPQNAVDDPGQANQAHQATIQTL